MSELDKQIDMLLSEAKERSGVPVSLQKAAERVLKLFGIKPSKKGLISIHAIPVEQSGLRVNVGDWLDGVSYDDIRNAASPVRCKIEDEAGKPPEDYIKLW